jgi:Phage tail tube protein, GTA-gp10
MPNLHRGEVEAHFDDRPHTLVLTLGALSELEAVFGATDMLALAERFQNVRISALDATRIIGAGLRGAGHAISDDDVGRMRTNDGAAGFVGIVAKLLAATFGGPVAALAADAALSAIAPHARRASAVEPPDPFPGPR